MEGNDRAAAQAGARAAQGRPQPEGLPDRHGNHGARESSCTRSRTRTAGKARTSATPSSTSSRIFGTPSAEERRGAGASKAITSRCTSPIANNTAVANTPAFFGTNPAEVRVEGPKKGLRILGSMEDAARALMATFDDAQRTSAIYDKVAPGDILTKNNPTFEALSPRWRRRPPASSRRSAIC